MQGFGAGLACGMGSGIAVGIATGMASGRATAHNQLKTLVDDGKIKVTDAEGNQMDADQLIALLSRKRKKS